MKPSLAGAFLGLLAGAFGGPATAHQQSQTAQNPQPAPIFIESIKSKGALYSMAIAHFEPGKTHVVLAGWTSDGTNSDVPIKIFQINEDGTASDVTERILGSEVAYSVNYPIVADFNGDGVDDLFLAGFHDYPVNDYGSEVFLSRSGSPHQLVKLNGKGWNHGVYAADLNDDGTVDVVSSEGKIWLNDGHGNFTFYDHNYNLNNPKNLWMHGSGVCAGDFNNTGHKQVVITDLNIDGNSRPIADTVIFEIDGARHFPTASHTMPVPVLDRNSTTIELSHDVTCRAVDLNGDGKLDLLVFSRPNLHARSSWTNEGVVQVLMNQGNWKFTDTTDTSMIGYPTGVQVSYTPIIEDLNGDGKPDLWIGNSDLNTGKSNMAWINDGNGIFTQSIKNIIDSLDSNGPAIPIKFGNYWMFIYSKITFDGNTTTYRLYATKAVYQF